MRFGIRLYIFQTQPEFIRFPLKFDEFRIFSLKFTECDDLDCIYASSWHRPWRLFGNFGSLAWLKFFHVSC